MYNIYIYKYVYSLFIYQYITSIEYVHLYNSSLPRLKGESVPCESPDLRLLTLNQGEKLDDIFKAIYDFRSVWSSMQEEASTAAATSSASLADLLKKAETENKILDTLMKNSNSDAKTISGLNTSLQSMKASVNGVNTTAKELKEALTSIETKVTELQSSSVAVETKLQTEIISSVGNLKDEIKAMLERTPAPTESPPPPPTKPSGSQIAKVLELTEKLVSKVTLLEVKQNIEASSKARAGKEEPKGGQLDKVLEELDTLGKDLKSQLDDVHDMVASIEDKTNGALAELKNDLNLHDKRTGISTSKIALVMRDILSQSQLISEKFSSLESRVGEGSESGGNLAKVVEQAVQVLEARGGGGGDSQQLTSLVDKVDMLAGKQDKLGKVVGRVKYLLESEEGEKEGGKRRKTKESRADKEEELGEDGVEKSLAEFRNRMVDELNNQADMLTEITNNIQVGISGRILNLPLV